VALSINCLALRYSKPLTASGKPFFLKIDKASLGEAQTNPDISSLKVKDSGPIFSDKGAK